MDPLSIYLSGLPVGCGGGFALVTKVVEQKRALPLVVGRVTVGTGILVQGCCAPTERAGSGAAGAPDLSCAPGSGAPCPWGDVGGALERGASGGRVDVRKSRVFVKDGILLAHKEGVLKLELEQAAFALEVFTLESGSL